jgi:hypothetical protein
MDMIDTASASAIWTRREETKMKDKKKKKTPILTKNQYYKKVG